MELVENYAEARYFDESDELGAYMPFTKRAELVQALTALITERDTLRERVAELEPDAARYRWLRNRMSGSAYRIAGVIYSEGGAGVDAAIDAAIASARGAPL